jgi:hypothetical protein
MILSINIKTTPKKNAEIEDIFEESKKIFIEELIKDNNALNNHNFITLTNKNNIIYSIKYEDHKKQGSIHLNHPLINLPTNYLISDDYVKYIFNIIKIILSGEQFINVYMRQDNKRKSKNCKQLNKKTIIGIEIMKFLYRHQIFDKLYYIRRPEKYGKSLNEIINKV